VTYRLVTTTVRNHTYSGIQCLVCGSTSYHPRDIAERYCGLCHVFHEDADFTRRVNLGEPESETPHRPTSGSVHPREPTR